MRVTVRFSGGKRPDFGNHDYEQLVKGSLARFGQRLKHVYLYIEDVNGPRGGVDKQCRCVLHLKHMPPVVIQDEGENLGALVYRVADRASYALSQAINRHNKRTKRGLSKREQAEANSTATDYFDEQNAVFNPHNAIV